MESLTLLTIVQQNDPQPELSIEPRPNIIYHQYSANDPVGDTNHRVQTAKERATIRTTPRSTALH